MPTRGTATRKLSRKSDQRAALLRAQAVSLIFEGTITTTETKAKTLRPWIEKLVTTAKKGDLHSKRQVIAALHDVAASDVLEDRASSAERAGGYTRITRGEIRRGDGAQMATISFVDEIKEAPKESAPKKDSKPNKDASEKKDSKKTEDKS